MGNHTESKMGKSVMLIIILLAQPVLIQNAGAEIRIDVNIIAELESGNNPMAYNAHEQAYGAHQIRRDALFDYNTAGPGRNRALSLHDMYDDFLSEHVCDWYVNTAIPKYLYYYHIPDTIDNRLIAYNAGIGFLASGKRIPASTRAYVQAYKDIVHERQ